MTETWCPFAVRHDGPATKVDGGWRTGLGAVLHSADGSLEGAFGELAKVSGAKPSDWQKSWHFTVDDSGIFQHYPLEAQTWHAGPAANPYYVGIEHTGR